MRELPILFRGAMVRVLPPGPKTQTRRVVKPQTVYVHDGFRDGDHLMNTANGFPVKCPYGYRGDRLWVRETFYAFGRWITAFDAKKDRDAWTFIDMTVETGHQYHYDVADPTLIVGAKGRGGVTPMWWKRPAIFMPRAASRILLEVTDVRVERLQDISEADAIAEGCVSDVEGDAADHYAELWETINGAGSWKANPHVWAVSFKRIT